MGHIARLLGDGVQLALLRNRVPLAWPMLLAPNEVSREDHVEYGEAFIVVRARSTGPRVATRLRRLAALGDTRFDAAGRLAEVVEGFGTLDFDVEEIDGLDEAGWTIEPLRKGAAVLESRLERLSAIARPLGWDWWLADGSERQSTRFSGLERLRAIRQTLAFGWPEDTEPFEAWWSDGPSAPDVSTPEADAEAVLTALQEGGHVSVSNPRWAARYLTIALKTREVGTVIQCLDAAEAAGNVQRPRGWFGRKGWNVDAIRAALAGLPD